MSCSSRGEWEFEGTSGSGLFCPPQYREAWQNLHLSDPAPSNPIFLTSESFTDNWLEQFPGLEPPPWRAIRGRLWLAHAIWLSGLTPKQFGNQLIHRGRSSSNLLNKWRSGKGFPSRASALAIERQVPKTFWLFELPLFSLLEDRALPQAELRKITKPWLSESKKAAAKVPAAPLDGLPGPAWVLPPDADGCTFYFSTDYESLAYRGDLWGLAALVALMRRSELNQEYELHALASAFSYRMLPSLLRISWCEPYVRDIFDALVVLQKRVHFSAGKFRADWFTIQSLARRKNYEPAPRKRPRDIHEKPTAYPDPIIPLRAVRSRKPPRW